MRTDAAEHPDREQVRETHNTLRIIGGLFFVVALLLYFFHLAEAPMGGSAIGLIAAVVALAGALIFCAGQWKLRHK